MILENKTTLSISARRIIETNRCDMAVSLAKHFHVQNVKHWPRWESLFETKKTFSAGSKIQVLMLLLVWYHQLHTSFSKVSHSRAARMLLFLNLAKPTVFSLKTASQTEHLTGWPDMFEVHMILWRWSNNWSIYTFQNTSLEMMTMQPSPIWKSRKPRRHLMIISINIHQCVHSSVTREFIKPVKTVLS